MGINVSDAIVLARYGEIYRGDIIENAYDAGAIGVLIYSDRKDYGGAGGEIIKSLGGVVANDGWQGGKDAPVYRVGPGPGIIDLTYKDIV
nr:hypothetical protein [Tanacetum cinerariifolium]